MTLDVIAGSFRQAQVSFSTRIPNAVPLGDAYSMSIDISLYNSGHSVIQFRDMVLKGAKSFKNFSAKANNEDAENSSTLPSVLEESDGEQKVDSQSMNEKEETKDEKKGQPDLNNSEFGEIFFFRSCFLS